MKKNRFPLIALVMGSGLALLAALGSQPMENGLTSLPLLMLLLASEFGFIVTLIGGVMGILQLRDQTDNKALMAVSVGCLLLATAFVYLGLHLWATL